MAVVHCREITGRDGSEDIRKNKRYTRTFQLLTDSPTDGAAIVRDHVELPEKGDAWESVNGSGVVTDTDLDAFCVDKRATQNNKDMPHDWLVVCEYVGKGDPTLEPPRVSFSTVKFQKTRQKDINGVLYANRLGEPFEGGIVIDKSRFTITIVRNVLYFNPVEVDPYLDSTNTLPFLVARYAPGYDPDTCKLADLSAEAVWYEDFSDIHYYIRTARIEVNREGWNCAPLNAGFCVYDSSSPIGRSPFLTGAGRSPVPIPLAIDGSPLPEGSAPDFMTGEFQDYPSMDWTVLDLEF